jgi:predicted tellurium resistance membrane protein TerC
MASDTTETGAVRSSASRFQSVLDLGSLALAGICSVHCLLTPVALVAFPLLGSTLVADGHFHVFMLALVLPMSLLAALIGCRRHKDRQVVIRLGIGLTLLVIGVVVGLAEHDHGGGHAHHEHAHAHLPLGTVITLIGGLAMIAGHWRNFRLCRSDRCDHRH